MVVLSPITNKPAKIIKSIYVADIIDKYQTSFNLDVSSYFEKYKSVEVYECNETKYRFYHPFGLEGDSKFYEHLQQYDWYYMPWKWEHRQVAKLLKPDMNVLEVGCAKGDFLEKVKKDFQVNVTGLELNESVTNKNISILNETIQAHSQRNIEKFDVVCSFQVLEHVADVKSFMEAKVKTLKKGGKLIVSVPNNSSFIKYSFDDNVLNMPPHHVGLWNKASLKKIASLFNLKFERAYFEPLQDYHFNWYLNIFEKRIKNRKILKKVYYKFRLKKYLRLYLKYFNFTIKGHSILAIYQKK